MKADLQAEMNHRGKLRYGFETFLLIIQFKGLLSYAITVCKFGGRDQSNFDHLFLSEHVKYKRISITTSNRFETSLQPYLT